MTSASVFWRGTTARCCTGLPLDEAHDELAVRAVRVLGAAPARWVSDYFRLPKQGMPKRLERLAQAGRLERIAAKAARSPGICTPKTSRC